jgi:hypothetical protein
VKPVTQVITISAAAAAKTAKIQIHQYSVCRTKDIKIIVETDKPAAKPQGN